MWGGYDTADGDITPHWLKGERYQHFGARAYDPVSCIFMQVDPMAEKYYGMTPYGYCLNNPILIVDYDGKKPRVYVETSDFGHALVTTGEGVDLTIYTMGRTGNIPKFFRKLGIPGLAPWGEGVLSILKGEDAYEYLSDRISHGIHYCIFEFNGEDSMIDEYYHNLFESGSDPTGGISMNKVYAKVISKYVLFYNNCVSTTIEGLSSAGIDVVTERGTLFLSPAEFISEIFKSHVECKFYTGKEAQELIQNQIDELSK